jgi:hypothetical protein
VTDDAMTLVEEDQGSHPLIRLKDLAGVNEIEALLATAISVHGKNWQWSAEFDQAKALAERVSRRLFGITEAETFYVDDAERSRLYNDEHGGWWEWHFNDFAANGQPAKGADWGSVDWEVTGADGELLLSLAFFYRQIVAMEFGLAGHPPGDGEDLSAAEAQDIEARLRAEAAKFKRKPPTE